MNCAKIDSVVKHPFRCTYCITSQNKNLTNDWINQIYHLVVFKNCYRSLSCFFTSEVMYILLFWNHYHSPTASDARAAFRATVNGRHSVTWAGLIWICCIYSCICVRPTPRETWVLIIYFKSTCSYWKHMKGGREPEKLLISITERQTVPLCISVVPAGIWRAEREKGGERVCGTMCLKGNLFKKNDKKKLKTRKYNVLSDGILSTLLSTSLLEECVIVWPSNTPHLTVSKTILASMWSQWRRAGVNHLTRSLM